VSVKTTAMSLSNRMDRAIFVPDRRCRPELGEKRVIPRQSGKRSTPGTRVLLTARPD